MPFVSLNSAKARSVLRVWTIYFGSKLRSLISPMYNRHRRHKRLSILQPFLWMGLGGGDCPPPGASPHSPVCSKVEVFVRWGWWHRTFFEVLYAYSFLGYLASFGRIYMGNSTYLLTQPDTYYLGIFICSEVAYIRKARRRAGEIVEATDNKPGSTAKAGSGGKSVTGGAVKSKRSGVRQELGISEHESTSWQALARIPKKTFDEFVEKVAVRGRKDQGRRITCSVRRDWYGRREAQSRGQAGC